MRKIKGFLQYLFAFLIIFMLLFAIASVVIVKFHGDTIQERTMQLVNAQLDTKVSVDQVGISVFRNFPYTSINLNNVTVWSGHAFQRSDFTENSDTLMQLGQVSLQFNLVNLLRNRYQVKKVELIQGELKLFIDKNGNSNLGGVARETESESAGLFELDRVKTKSLKIWLNDRSSGNKLSAEIQDLALSGNFSAGDYALDIQAESYIHTFTLKEKTYLSNEPLTLDMQLMVEEFLYTISRGSLKLGALNSTLKGSMLLDPEVGADLDLHMEGVDIPLEWLLDKTTFITSSPMPFEASGLLNLQLDVSGLATATILPKIDALFELQQGTFLYPESELKISEIAFAGAFNSGEIPSSQAATLNLQLEQAKYGNSQVTGSIAIANFSRPRYTCSMNAAADLNDLEEFLAADQNIALDGSIEAELKVSGKYDPSVPLANQLPMPTAKVRIMEAAMDHGGTKVAFSHINGNLELAEDQLRSNLQLDFLDIPVVASLEVKNLSGYIGKTELLEITGELSGSSVDVDRLIAHFKKEEAHSDAPTTYPENISVEVDFSLKDLKKSGVITERLNGTLEYKYPAFSIDPIYLETMDGVINSRLKLSDLQSEQHQLSLVSEFRDVKIEQLFRSLNNFNQQFLTEEQIRGTFEGHSEVLAVFDREFNFLTEALISRNSFIIRDGALIDFKPLIKMGQMLKVGELNNVKFSTLENTILIQDNRIEIPEMEINSSAFNLNASGFHRFDNEFEYHIATKLSELLYKKANRNQDREFQIALDEEDKRTVFLLLYDQGDGMFIEFDDAQALKKIRTDLREERTELKVILNEEFGLFKKDDAVKNREEKSSEDAGMRFEFPDDPPLDTIQKKQEAKPRWWKRKRDENTQNEPLIIFEDEDI